MSDEEMRIAIAEACGWRPVAGEIDGKRFWLKDGMIAALRLNGNDLNDGKVYLPDYCNDLNACHEMEKVLRFDRQTMQPGGWVDYIKCLCEVVGCRAGVSDDNYKACTFATARQRAEPFLRTLGKRTASEPERK